MMVARTLGFDWKVQLAWLDETAARVAAGSDTKELRGRLDDYLQRQAEVSLSPTARSKAITVLSHLWCDVPDDLLPFRDRAIDVLHEVLPDERVVIHWSMALATYPFFADVTAAVGTLLSLQGVADIPSVRRRVAERWGERSTVSRATGVVVGTIRDWGLLTSAAKGRSEGVPPMEVSTPLSAMLVEALLESQRVESISIADALSHPSLFPFRLRLTAAALRSVPSLAVERFGGGTDVARLARSSW